jgi:uncharacterized protein YlxW (UPF0749 family)
MSGDGAIPDGTGPDRAWARVRGALRLKRDPSHLLVGGLFALLGFGIAVQAGAADDNLATARQSDLVGILDDLSVRSDRLQAELRDLTATRDRLQSGSAGAEAALAEAERRAAVLGILAGTVAAEGPGLELTIAGVDDAALLLDTVQELRDAGAEAIQLGDVRVVASTYFTQAPDGRVQVDGVAVDGPYEFRVIGDPRTLSAALRIPGGVLDSVRGAGGDATIVERESVRVDALRALSAADYAQPAP